MSAVYFDVLVEGESERLRFFLLMGDTLYFENLPDVYSCSSAGMSFKCNMVDWVVCRCTTWVHRLQPQMRNCLH
ncbi:hypothetical protein L6452_06608 [Arctium lappa]|uniref:Uncharacterized protein n=1 Tax=Arctium lappa TaxID=4217 RepID=A0ACB9EK64_ARCLA|nr:hypothetical protein L6452_06608 [Arctium lappa]